MITGTSTNYTGRRVDLSLFPTILSSGIPVVGQIGSTPQAVAGLSAMAQNFIRILLTPLGTYRADPLMGSNFYSNLTSLSASYPSDISQSFLVESDRVLQYMDASYSPTTPLDERVKSVSLADVTVAATSVSLTIQIESMSGVDVSFLLPVSWNF